MRTTAARLVLGSLVAAALALPAAGQDTASLHAGTRNAITGKVVDKSGKPIAGAVVTLVEKDAFPSGSVRFHIVSHDLFTQTDERGEYRLDNLRLGEFYVVAIPHNAVLTDGRVNRSGFQITYYPSAPRAAGAMPVSVNVREAATADITMLPAVLSVVSGTVIGENGQPVKEGILGIAHGDNLFGIDSRGIRLRPDGSFLLPALPPGTYFLEFHESPQRPARGVTPLMSAATLVVDGHDIAGIRVAPIHPVTVTGRVIVDAADRTLLPLTKVSILGRIADGNPGPTMAGTLEDDLTFHFRVWPRPAIVEVRIDDPAWDTKAVRLNGADVTNKPIDFKEGQNVTGLEIALVRRGRQ